jgi:hypothetical protein
MRPEKSRTIHLSDFFVPVALPSLPLRQPSGHKALFGRLHSVRNPLIQDVARPELSRTKLGRGRHQLEFNKTVDVPAQDVI